ncbi:MAG: D-alanyl-D-alanine carboxypeptidase [Candidatus Buchananbacteria bacterium]|nr:D-alanyl-D-alanine carboxypeptidase [Candidatus Buchananbacteria bacterium]
MIKVIASLIIASLFFPTGANFLTDQPVDFSYPIQTNSAVTTPTRIINDSLGIKTTASSVLVVDQNSQAILYQKNINTAQSIASITKLLTALTFLDHNPGFDQTFTLDAQDQRAGGLVNLWPGEQVIIKDLFYLTLVSSTNEAAAALARSTGLKDFSDAMNAKAKELGIKDSYFVDPTGLDPANVSTPLDLSLLVNAAFANSEIVQAVKNDSYRFKVINNGRVGLAQATDKLLGSFIDQGEYKIIGAKTGYLDEAGYCLVMAVERVDGVKLSIILLNAGSQVDRWQEAKGLVDWTFSNYQW